MTTKTRVAGFAGLLLTAGHALGAPTLTENFNDNTLDPALWCVFEDAPSIAMVNETNQRLEVSSSGNPGSEGNALIYNCGWALDSTKNFKWRVDFAVSDPGISINGEIGITAACWFGGDGEIGGGPDLTAVAATIGREFSETYFGSEHIANGTTVVENFESPAPLASGTVYFSYQASTDTLTVSAIEYDGADAVAYSGLRAAAGNNTAGIALGGFSAGSPPPFPGSAAWMDNLVINAGTLANPCVADIDGNGALNVDDIESFVALFLGGDLATDCDGSGVLNVDDIECFVAAFLAGCP
ncbi:MAG: hypothetical protein DHS20C14_19800 [Phycisphaeraceae bacterium]|nr:MAG: hypothetical protein DHS20C14_19800 [Phycisphaeraceae bacterium]